MLRNLLLVLLLAGPAAAQSIELTVNGPTGALAGTLEGTTGAQAALILPGSGPTDRNGNNAAGLSTDAYRLLAEGLAAGGFPTLRIDKRGIGESGGDGNAVSLAAYRDDTAAWIAALRAETGAECVWLIGHSEGGIIALFSANLPDLCGLILLATPGRPLGPILVEQIANHPLYGGYVDAITRVVEDLSAGLPLNVDGLPIELALLFQPATLGYLTELIATDPAELVRGLTLPILAVTGDTDAQVPADAGDHLFAANPDVEVATLPGMTHTFKQVAPGDFAAGAVSYAVPTLPLHEDLLPLLLSFLQGAE